MKTRWTWAAAGLAGLVSPAIAQGPGDEGPPRPASKEADAADLVARTMAFDKDGDGKLTRAELVDDRLTDLFDRADTNKDGAVTKEELSSLGSKEHWESEGFGPGFGPPGFGPPGGGPGGPGGPMMPRPGDVLPAMLRNRLRVTAEQKAQLDELQKLVDSRLESILDDGQKVILKEMRQRGPRGPGGPGSRPGPLRRGR